MLGFLFKSQAPAPANEDPGASELALVRMAMDEDYADVEELAHQLGLHIRRPSFCNEIAGCLTYGDGYWSLGVNANATKNRQRFTIAHEIAHYLLHRDLILKDSQVNGVYDNNSYRQPVAALLNSNIEVRHEQQATMLAVRTLMSETKMRRLCDAGMSIFQIADRIGCSVGATKIRLESLGLPLNGH